MKKNDDGLPRLDEVFLVQNRNVVNVGSAYSRRMSVNEAGYNMGTLKPELEKVVDKYVKHFQDSGVHQAVSKRLLHAFAHELEGAEGEDPAELDRGGPPPGSTGGK